MYFSKRKATLLGLAILVGVLWLSVTQVALANTDGDEGDTVAPGFKVFAPLINKPTVYLTGTITYRGAPVANQTVELRLYDGSGYSTIDSAVTDSHGNYQMPAPATLTDSQMVYLRWLNNSGNDAWLYSWFCDEITTAPASNVVCSFDIQDVSLTPSSEAVTLPYTFQWSRRVTPSDSYEYNLYDPYDGDPWLWSERLGYVSSYRLSSVPSSFATYATYGWWVGVYGPGGYGESFYYMQIYLTNRGVSGVAPTMTVQAVPNQLHLDPPRH